MTKHPKKARDRQKEYVQLNINLSTGQLGKQANPQQTRASGRGSQATWEKPGVNRAESGKMPDIQDKIKSITPLCRNPWNTLIPKQEILLGKAHLSLNHPL